jgi:hypothetical protein
MSQIVYAALFVVFIGACALGLLLAVLAEVLSGRRRRPWKRIFRPHKPVGPIGSVGTVISARDPASERAEEASAHRARTGT